MKVPRGFGSWSSKIRSASVGAIATLVDLSLLALLVHVGVRARVAGPLTLLAGVGVQFVGNKVFAFRDPSGRWGRQLAAFFSVEAGALALNALGFDLLVGSTSLPPLAARVLVSSAVYFLFCLPLWSRVFARAPGAAPAVR